MEIEEKKWWKKEIQKNNKKIKFINGIIYILLTVIFSSIALLAYIFVYLSNGGSMGPIIISEASSKLVQLCLILVGIFGSYVTLILNRLHLEKSYYHSTAMGIVEQLKNVGRISSKCTDEMMQIIARELTPCDNPFTSKKECGEFLEKAAKELADACKKNLP